MGFGTEPTEVKNLFISLSLYLFFFTNQLRRLNTVLAVRHTSVLCFFLLACEGGVQFQPVITSYDYDSPISEGGKGIHFHFPPFFPYLFSLFSFPFFSGGHGYGSDGDKFKAIQNLLSNFMFNIV